MNEEKEKTYKIVRSLIISCNPRDGLSLMNLLRDFREYVGIALPLFEYKNAVEFLRASGEFDIDIYGGEYIIYAKTSPKSRHISKFVAEQNKPRENRSRVSVQNRISTDYRRNDWVIARTSQRFQQQPMPTRSHRAASTVEFSFESLKSQRSQQQENNDERPCTRNGVSTVVFSFEQLKLQQKEKTNSESNQSVKHPIHSSERKDGDSQRIYDDIVVPELKPEILTPVKISHISDRGYIFIQLQQSDVDCVKKLITQFIRKVSNNPFVPFEKVVPISGENLFVVQDPENNKLYRAKVINDMDGGSNMFFIDYGYSKLIPSSKMYLIDTVYRDEEICRFPPQAIRTKLHGVNDSSVSGRLRSHFSVKKNVYVRKIPSSAIVPEVKLYFDAESFMVCVNDSLELEKERSQMTIGTSNHYDHDVSDASRASHTADTVSNTHSIVDRTFVETSFTSFETPTIKTFLPPKLNCSFEIEIVKTESPSSFVIKPTEYIPQWQKQMKALQAYCKEPSATLTLDMIRDGEAYACLKSNGFWYRAIIKFHRTKIYAFFCDISDIDLIDNLRKIKFLPNEYRNIPKLAMTAKLFGIAPVSGSWEMDDKIQFRRMTKGRIFMAEVKSLPFDEENSILEIVLKYNDSVVNDLFVASGRATAIRSDVNEDL